MFRLTHTSLLLSLILIAFLAREIFLAGSFPLFVGQDEARHYNTVQWLSGKKDMRCFQATNTHKQDKDNIATYSFSEEIRETSAIANLSVWREENYRKPAYTNGNMGQNESSLQNSSWSKDSPLCPPDIVPQVANFSFFHFLGHLIEEAWAKSDVLTRFYLVRIMTVLLGAATVLLAYFCAIEAGFSRRISLLISLILSLQPRLAIYTTNINYDALLIPCFALFLWAGLRALRQGFTLPNIAFLALAFGTAALTKGTGLVLLIGALFLGGVAIITKHGTFKNIPLRSWLIRGGFVLLLLILLSSTYSFSRLLPSLSFSSLFEYLGKSLPRIPSSSENFWGTISWNSSIFGPWFVYAIWIIEAFALVGLIRFFYLKEALSFLPTKTVTLFCITLMFALQLGVRLHDWHVFQETGQLILGTPGRYFLPALLPQLLLVAVGLGALLRQKLALERALLVLALIMLAFNLYTVWLIIIPRFYL